jgi:hypothetical protein
MGGAVRFFEAVSDDIPGPDFEFIVTVPRRRNTVMPRPVTRERRHAILSRSVKCKLAPNSISK